MRNGNGGGPHRTDSKNGDTDGSTIFVKREYTNATPKTANGAKNRLRNLGLLALCTVIIAVGVYAVIKFIPVSDGQTQINPDGLSVTAISKPIDTITEISVVQADNEYTVVLDKDENIWRIEGIDSELTNSDTIATFVSACTSLTAQRRLENNGADFGLNSPYLKISVNYEDTKMNYDITVGGQTADKKSRYFSVTGDSGIFVVDSETTLGFEKNVFDFAQTLVSEKTAADEQNTEYFEASTIKFFDVATVRNGKGELVFKFERDVDSQEYKMVYPEQKQVTNDSVSEYLSFLTTNTYAAGVYAYSKEDYSKFGFGEQYTIIVSAADGKYKNE
ncbi:MAG: DUF4340 domain-containing protein [bacterium]|nr:DUF4340 domain-containing protein [bacterium]